MNICDGCAKAADCPHVSKRATTCNNYVGLRFSYREYLKHEPNLELAERSIINNWARTRDGFSYIYLRESGNAISEKYCVPANEFVRCYPQEALDILKRRQIMAKVKGR